MDHGGGGEGDSAQPFWFSKDSLLHHFEVPQERRVHFPPLNMTLKGWWNGIRWTRGRNVEVVMRKFQNVQHSFWLVLSPALWWSLLRSQFPSLSRSLSPCQGEGEGRGRAVEQRDRPRPPGCCWMGKRQVDDVKGGTSSTEGEKAEGWQRTLGRKMPVSSGVKRQGVAWSLWGPLWSKSYGSSQFFNGSSGPNGTKFSESFKHQNSLKWDTSIVFNI